MKIMVLSDTHGDTYYTGLALDLFRKEKYDKLFLLGDLGRETIELLNPLHDKILAVKGNCDSDSLEDLARFPFDSAINFDYDFGKVILLTHGHLFHPYTFQGPYDIFLQGHTHESFLLRDERGKILGNPGSLGEPRDYNHSYLSIDETGLKVKDVESGEVVHFLDF